MEQLELKISFPFRLDGKREQWPECIFHYNSQMKEFYTEALKKELAAASEDAEDACICAVTLEGCFFLMEYEQLMDVAQTVRRHFTLAEDVIWSAHCEPGRLSTGILNFCKNVKMKELCLDYRTSSVEEAKKLEYPPAHTEMQHTKQVLEHSVFTDFTIAIGGVGCNQTEEIWSETLQDVGGFAPMAIRLAADTSEEKIESAAKRLAGFGYEPYIPETGSSEHAQNPSKVFVRQGRTFPVAPPPDGTIGCGLGAITRLDGMACQNTLDFPLYLEASDQIARIAHTI